MDTEFIIEGELIPTYIEGSVKVGKLSLHPWPFCLSVGKACYGMASARYNAETRASDRCNRARDIHKDSHGPRDPAK